MSDDNTRYIKNFDGWNEKKKQINERLIDADQFILEGEIWWTSIGVNIGHEIDGKHADYKRPVLILMKFDNDPQWVLPITSKMIQDGGFLHKIQSSRICGYIPIQQMRSISSKRLLRLAGRLNDEEFIEIRNRLSRLLIKPNPP